MSPEPDMYHLVMKSKLPAAEKFEEWVMEKCFLLFARPTVSI
jgi:prophage antirepressor-like protein